MKRKLFILITSLLLLFAWGCSPEVNSKTNPERNDEEQKDEKLKDEILIVNSFNTGKELPHTLFEIEMKKEYLLDGKLEIKIKYGHLDDYPMTENEISLLNVNYIPTCDDYLSDIEDIISGTELLRVDDFYSTKYNVSYEYSYDDHMYCNFVFASEFIAEIPRKEIVNSTGVLMFSFIELCKDDDGKIDFKTSDGMNIYLSYVTQNNKIYFQIA